MRRNLRIGSQRSGTRLTLERAVGRRTPTCFGRMSPEHALERSAVRVGSAQSLALAPAPVLLAGWERPSATLRATGHRRAGSGAERIGNARTRPRRVGLLRPFRNDRTHRVLRLGSVGLERCHDFREIPMAR
jgi:hypothetical protein